MQRRRQVLYTAAVHITIPQEQEDPLHIRMTSAGPDPKQRDGPERSVRA